MAFIILYSNKSINYNNEIQSNINILVNKNIETLNQNINVLSSKINKLKNEENKSKIKNRSKKTN